jgi:DegV family protein with EDD domain
VLGVGSIAIVTDSTADLAPDLARDLGISVVPLIATIDGVSYQDGSGLPAAAFYDKLASARTLPSTSQPSIGAFKQAYEAIDAEDILSIHISGKLSGTTNSARAAAEQVSGKHIKIFDSLALSLALGYVARTAADMANAGSTLAEVSAEIERLIPKCGFYAVLDTLQHARRSGRISFAQALMGSVLQVKPILTLRDGAVQGVDRPRTMRKALERLEELTLADAPFAYLAMAHANNEPLAGELANRLAPSFEGSIDVVCTGAVIGTHCGPGAVASCYVRK